MKKRALPVLLLLLAALLACSGCSSEGGTSSEGETSSTEEGTSSSESAPAPVDPDALIAGILEKYAMTDGFVFTSSSTEPGEYLDDDLIASYYGDAAQSPDFSKVSRYCVYVDESNAKALIDVGLFELNDPSYGAELMQYLRTRIDDKIESAIRYPDIDVAMLKTAVVKQEGAWVYYSVNYDAAAIAAELAGALS